MTERNVVLYTRRNEIETWPEWNNNKYNKEIQKIFDKYILN